MPLYEYEGARPVLPASGRFFVAPDAVLIGRVAIAEDVSIWFNAVLRGDNEPITVGPRSNVQDGCVLHTDPGFPLVVGAGCTVGHAVILHGCTIGDNCLIGMGATVQNGARIGKNSLVGANALVTEGKEFPERSLIVGMPARLIRTIDDQTVKMITLSCEIYVNRWQQYAKSLKRVD
ncbi:MAG TPA: gamma carbonic anhydrase family protein [Xanthobacteraceae bacterium]|nr:gamma carbonic anhydrase family protein [Xanthobacteraceae bacterium]